MLNKGISPVIATVILVAVALLLAVALTGWVMGMWGTIGSVEALQIVSVHLDTGSASDNLEVKVINKGTTPANISTITVKNATKSLEAKNCDLMQIGPQNLTKITCTVENAESGRIYTLEIVTLGGGVFTYDFKAK